MNGAGYIPVGSLQKTHILWYIFDLIEVVYQDIYIYMCVCIYIYIYIYANMPPQDKITIYITEGVFN